MRKRLLLLVILAAAAGAGVYAYSRMAAPALVLTGIVTTNDVIVSPQIAGQIAQLLVKEGDQVKKDQRIAVIAPDELKAATAKLDSLKKQVDAQRATVALARANAEQVAVRRNQLATTQHMQAAAAAQ